MTFLSICQFFWNLTATLLKVSISFKWSSCILTSSRGGTNVGLIAARGTAPEWHFKKVAKYLASTSCQKKKANQRLLRQTGQKASVNFKITCDIQMELNANKLKKRGESRFCPVRTPHGMSGYTTCHYYHRKPFKKVLLTPPPKSICQAGRETLCFGKTARTPHTSKLRRRRSWKGFIYTSKT